MRACVGGCANTCAYVCVLCWQLWSPRLFTAALFVMALETGSNRNVFQQVKELNQMIWGQSAPAAGTR